MKILTFFLISNFSFAISISHNDWVKTIQEKNIVTKIEILKLEQSRLHIKEKLARIIPSLNLGTVADATVNGPAGFVSGLSNFVGFIMPSRWFEWEESKMFYLSQYYSYMTVKGNLILLSEELFLSAKRNQLMLNILEENVVFLEQMSKSIYFREKIGELPRGTYARIYAALINYINDQQQLSLAKDIYLTEMNNLIQDTSLNTIEDLDLLTARDQVIIDDFEFEKYSENLIELKNFHALYIAAKFSKKSRLWGLMDFGGEGFGMGYFVGNSMAKVDLQLVEAQLQQASMNLRTQFKTLKLENSSLMEQNENLLSGIEILNQRINQIITEYKISGEIYIDDYLENLNQLNGFKFKQVIIQTKLDYIQATKERLTLKNFYLNLQDGIPERNLKKLKRYQKKEDRLIDKYLNNSKELK